MPTDSETTGTDWSVIARQWQLRPDTIYLNHGSFGPSPEPVRAARREWIAQLDSQPMEFFVRRLEPAIQQARESVARFVGTGYENLVFVENATFGMNVVADSFPLSAGDEVLINNHEYGAVHRIWERACRRRRAVLNVVNLPTSIESAEQVSEAVTAAVTGRTRLIVVSHITSPTALIMPVELICNVARQRGVAVCVDGPHAPAQLALGLDDLGCDFYTASCHKWLSAPFGSGFLYVGPKWQGRTEPQLKSWGRLLPAMPARWDEEFIWSGTRDPSAYLSIPAAIEFLRSVGIGDFRQRCRQLARYAEARLCDLFGTRPIAADSRHWYGTMAHVPLPAGDWSTLQQSLWEQDRIEVPIIDFDRRWFVRVSCHLYNDREQVDTLIDAMTREVCSKI